MTEREIRLVNLVNEHDNPEQAIMVAIQVICDYLKQSQSFVEPSPVDLQELA